MNKVAKAIKEKFGMSMQEFQEHLANLSQEKAEKIAQSISLESLQIELANRILDYKHQNNFTWVQVSLNLGVSEIMLRKVVMRERNFSQRQADFVSRQLYKRGV